MLITVIVTGVIMVPVLAKPPHLRLTAGEMPTLT